MPVNFASVLLCIALVATIIPPGYPAYIGAYTALAAALLALVFYARRHRSGFLHPTSLAIIGAIALVAITVPFVYRGAHDLLAPILILPMLSTVALGLLAGPARWAPGPSIFALICLLAAAIALVGGAYEHFAFDVYRPGLGNNPIHYGSLAAMAGGLALVGVVGSNSPWRYGFLLGPVFGLGATILSDSRGPMVGAAAIAAVGMLTLLLWLWREKLFRFSVLAALAIGVGGAVALIGNGSSNMRIVGLFDSALNIFRFTGGTDDIRAALYASALDVLQSSSWVGVGLGQVMDAAQRLFPEQAETFTLDNLHADWANFATMAGGLGLLAWLLLLAAPLLLLIDARVRQSILSN
ncbi:O-antigen ligase family protein [Devosia sp. MC1541]|uniref:O-antigen ligase family protein n=1 Tax=Devosia sp. MC1541 TaxID=2725264 RepID=UPI00145C791E|nr:O-antigen ligase family protein [Devosia sp. MC1541]